MLKPIKTNQECEQALERVYNLMQKNIKPNSKESDELEILSILIKEYESTVYTVEPNVINSDPDYLKIPPVLISPPASIVYYGVITSIPILLLAES